MNKRYNCILLIKYIANIVQNNKLVGFMQTILYFPTFFDKWKIIYRQSLLNIIVVVSVINFER